MGLRSEQGADPPRQRLEVYNSILPYVGFLLVAEDEYYENGRDLLLLLRIETPTVVLEDALVLAGTEELEIGFDGMSRLHHVARGEAWR